jgi:small subunit ribosomal protein S18
MAIKTIKDKSVIRYDWRNYEELKHFMTERAKILPRKRTGLSPKNQRKLAKAIKHARHLGLLPYKAEI